MEQHHDGGGSIVSLMVGFFLAFTNHLFGWLGSIHLTSHWDSWIQALFLGIIGSTATFFTNKFWKTVEKKLNKRKE